MSSSIFCVQSVNLFTYRLAPTELASVALPYSIATDIIMSTRLILHIREAFFGPGDDGDQTINDKTIPLTPLRARSQGVHSVRSGTGSRRIRGSTASYLNDLDFEDDDLIEESDLNPGVMITVEISTDATAPRRSAFQRQDTTQVFGLSHSGKSSGSEADADEDHGHGAV